MKGQEEQERERERKREGETERERERERNNYSCLLDYATQRYTQPNVCANIYQG